MGRVGKYDIEVIRGITLDQSLALTNSDTGAIIDLTGYECKIQVREDYDTAVLFEMTEDNGRLLIPFPATGVINMIIANTDTINMTFEKGIFTLVMFSVSESIVLFEGDFIVRKNTTNIS